MHYITYLPNMLSFCNLLLGYSSIVLSLFGRIDLACVLLIFCVGCDMLDGYVARKCHATSELGKQLDSLIDLVSFGVAPIIIVLAYTGFSLGSILIGSCFLVSGCFRLARFNTTAQAHKKTTYYKGLPITTNGILVPGLVVINTHPILLLFALALSAFLMSSTIPIKKL